MPDESSAPAPATTKSAPEAADPKNASPAGTAAETGAAEDVKMTDSEPAPTSATATATAAAADPAREQGKQEVPAKPAQEPSEEPSKKPAADADVEMKGATDSAAAPAAPAAAAAEEPSTDNKDDKAQDAAPAPGDSTAAQAPAASSKAKTPARRKSGAASQSSGKKLNRKGSKAHITHTDAKPGDQFFIKLKGYPLWPCIICDEDMLPHSLLKTRPVGAARPDGSYREDFADGGKRAADRNFPIMYLSTNEFGWVSNKDLVDLDPDTIRDSITPKMRKDLVAAHELAAEKKDLDYYKGVLQQFQEDMIEKQKAAEAKAAATPTPKKSKKASKAAAAPDQDVEMADADEEPASPKPKKGSKRKNEDQTPQRSDSVKKPKIKITNNSTPKAAANGDATPKSAKSVSESKASKSKSSQPKRAVKEVEVEKEVHHHKEPELSPEERHQRKEKEVLFLRHKLQKGLLTRDQQPKEEEMKLMSDYITKLEGFPELEVSIIRATKINKVLKAILKLEFIPKEEEFKFKPRSQVMLDKWNKILAVEDPPHSATHAHHSHNGVNGSEASKKEEHKPAPNGVKKVEAEPSSKAEEKKETDQDTKKDAKDEEKKAAKKEEPASEDKRAVDETAKPAKEAVETAA